MVSYMPSHKIHAIVGKLICDFSSRDIDELIDSYKHDLSRIYCKEFFEQATTIYEKYGSKGICYLALHHYLDKLSSIIKGRTIRLLIFQILYRKTFSVNKLINEIRVGLNDEISVLSLLTTHESLLYTYDPYTRIFYHRRTLIEKGYSKATARRKTNLLFEIVTECRNTIERMKEIYGSDYEVMMFVDTIKQGVERAYLGVLFNLNKILCILLAEEKDYWVRFFGRETYNSIITTLNCNK